MSRGATILHADLDAFYASVAQRDDPALRGRPVLVGGSVVLAASYEARAFGVRSGMGGGRARRLCPDAVVVPTRFEAYTTASRAVFAIFRETAPDVEPLSIDEAFLDVRGLEAIGAGTPAEIAARLRREVREQVGLPLSVGVATTKHLAKVASAAAKPDGVLVVAPGQELGFLHPLPVERLWGVGPATARKLHAHALTTVGDVAALPVAALAAILGRASAGHLHAVANNRDPRRVRPRRGRRSFGSQSALGPARRRGPQELDAVAIGLVDRVSRRMRAAGQTGRTVILRLRFADYTRASRARTLRRPTAATPLLLAALRELLAAERQTIAERGLTLMGITVTGLEGPGGDRQLTLPLDGPGHGELDDVVDRVRDRFGTGSLRRAVLLDHREAAPWLVPDDDAGQ